MLGTWASTDRPLLPRGHWHEYFHLKPFNQGREGPQGFEERVGIGAPVSKEKPFSPLDPLAHPWLCHLPGFLPAPAPPLRGDGQVADAPLPALPGLGAGPCPGALFPLPSTPRQPTRDGALSPGDGASPMGTTPSPPRAAHRDPRPLDWPRIVRSPLELPSCEEARGPG